jgi:glycosyltransferase involved in cell wall biosynthesis
MILPVCLSETYSKSDSEYISESVSYNFFKKSNINVKIIAPVIGTHEKFKNKNSVVKENIFVELPYFNSIKSFAFNYYLNKKFRKKTDEIFIKQIDSSEIVWARNPSLASIIFSELALKKNKILISHICADIEYSWKNPKYKYHQKIFAYFMSKFILYKLQKITKNKNTYSLCTGTKLYKQFKCINKNTIQFVDSLIKESDLKSKETINNKFIFVGRLNIEKGILDLLKACEILKSRNINFSLDIIGFGNLKKDIEKLIRKNKLSNEINFIGSLAHNEVQKFYEKNSIFILPSNADYEGFPRVILEAWAFGMPVITTNVGGIKGLGQDGKNLLFAERMNPLSIAGCMEKIILDKDLKKTMQEYIIKDRDKITIENQKQMIYELIDLKLYEKRSDNE